MLPKVTYMLLIGILQNNKSINRVPCLKLLNPLLNIPYILPMSTLISTYLTCESE